MRRSLARSLIAVAAVALAIWASSGCGGGGGGGGGGGPTAPPPPVSGVTFTPSSTAGSNSVYLAAGQGGAPGIFVLDVRVSQVPDLYGVSFVLEFPQNLLSWRQNGTVEGSLLDGGGGVRTELLVVSGSDGNLVIGHSRIGAVEGISSSGTLFSLEFASEASGSGTLRLTNRTVVDSFGVVQSDVTWIGGTVNVRLP